MIKGLDHVVILVRDLDTAVRDYTALGFTVVPGGEHADGKSRNALVSFADGAYLELIAFQGAVPKEHPFYREGVDHGLITYALLPDNVERTVQEARERGLGMTPPRSGGRLRPDGVRLDWQTSQPPSRDLPFLCYDITSRDLRVPGGDAHKHANGATGIQRLGIAVENVSESKKRYSALLGPEAALGDIHPPDGTQRSAFQVGGTAIVLMQSVGNAHLKKYLQRRGEGPYRMVLQAEGANARHGHVDPQDACGVMLGFRQPAEK
ncbi:MAG TPA: VOC family protein [Chloroflexia bacterium]|nr:VOC family protein [Chloroflexia bacterium]